MLTGYRNPDEERMDETLKWLLYFLLGVAAVLVVFILFSFKKPGEIVLAFLAIGSAYLFAGAVVGFLFAIPRSGIFRYKDNNDTSKSWYYDNANLEDISDWLTKIIVGLTLVQFDRILNLLDTSARSISSSFGVPCVNGCKYYSLAYGLIIFFTVSGFAISYLWTRVNFALILTVTKRRLAEIEYLEEQRRKAEEEKQKADAASKEAQKEANEKKVQVKEEQATLEKIKDEVSSSISQENVRKTDHAFFLHEITKSSNGDESKKKLQKLIEQSKAKPISDPSDIQKNRWGGKDAANDKKLSADVTANVPITKYYNVLLKVGSTVPNKPIEGPIAFFVHDSFGFPDNVVIANVDKNTGEAQLNLVAYEAFTVGALCPDGTELELDLNEGERPEGFKWEPEK